MFFKQYERMQRHLTVDLHCELAHGKWLGSDTEKVARSNGGKFRILGEAIATNAEAGLADVVVCRTYTNGFDDFEQVDVGPLGELAPFIDESDVCRAVGVFEDLRRFGGGWR